jgi:lactate permease
VPARQHGARRVGNPIRVLNGVTDLPMHELNSMVGRILPPFSFILPAWLVVTMVGWKRALEVLPALVVSGASFAAMQYYWSNYQETGLVDIVAAIFSLLAMVAFLRFWKPRELMEEGEGERTIELREHGVWSVLKGWSPFALASLFIFLWALPGFTRYLKIPFLTFPTPWLDGLAIRTPPVVPVPTPESASIDVNFFALPGTAVFLGGFLAALLLGLGLGRALRLLARTFRQLVPSMLAISFMVGLAYITKYSGMDTVLGLSLTRTGWIYPFFGTLLGWLGVALTGTDAGSNALFGNLQKVTAEQIGISPVLMASANSAGGVMGKMIDAQSIVVASAACRLEGREADVWKAVFWHSLTLACLVGLVVLLYAYVIPWVIPG